MGSKVRKLEFCQVFGNTPTKNEISPPDLITSLEFDSKGDILAVGDRQGRVVLLQRDSASKGKERPRKYKFFYELQSHLPVFDNLRSQDIEEKINDIAWLKSGAPGRHSLLSCNDKTIKYFSVREKMTPFYQDDIPSRVTHQEQLAYLNAHSFHINSLNVTADQTHFFSTDDLRINLWDINRNDTCLTMVDLHPGDFENLNEVISCSAASPNNASLMAFGTSKGDVYLCDTRQNCLLDRGTMVLSDVFSAPKANSLMSITCCLGGLSFNNEGTLVAARDYLCTKVWDLRNTTQLLSMIPVHDQILPEIESLYFKEVIFDRFKVRWSHDDSLLLTGSYSDNFLFSDVLGKWGLMTEAKRFSSTKSLKSPPKNKVDDAIVSSMGGSYTLRDGLVVADALPTSTDYFKKILHVDCHPEEDIFAVATLHNIYIYDLQ